MDNNNYQCECGSIINNTKSTINRHLKKSLKHELYVLRKSKMKNENWETEINHYEDNPLVKTL